MASTILFPQFFLPLKSFKLGRLVASVTHPHQHYHDPAFETPPEPLVSIRNNYSGTQQNTKGSSFSFALTSLLSSEFSKQAKIGFRIGTGQVKTYLLENVSQVFQEAMKLEETQKWVEKTIDEGDSMYFIIGFHTLVDAQILQATSDGKTNGGRVELPVNMTLAAMGVIMPFGDIVNPRVGGENTNKDVLQAQFVAPGEQICAFQYKKVIFRWLSRKEAATAILSKRPQWVSTDASRDIGQSGEDEDTVEVNIEGDDAAEEGWDKVETFEGDTIFVPEEQDL